VALVVKGAHSTWHTDNLTASQRVAHHNTVPGTWSAQLKEAGETEFKSQSSGHTNW